MCFFNNLFANFNNTLSLSFLFFSLSSSLIALFIDSFITFVSFKTLLTLEFKFWEVEFFIDCFFKLQLNLLKLLFLQSLSLSQVVGLTEEILK